MDQSTLSLQEVDNGVFCKDATATASDSAAGAPRMRKDDAEIGFNTGGL